MKYADSNYWSNSQRNNERTLQTINKKTNTQCVIDGKLLSYDACGEGDRERLDKIYFAFRYIGSSNITVINGKEKIQDEIHHFYVRK